jgi:hypothetical protein
MNCGAGNLFLVRHTLLLREQLLPFNIRFTTVERVLSFSTTGLALTRFVSNPSHLLRFNAHNALLQLAQEGLPRLEETRVLAFLTYMAYACLTTFARWMVRNAWMMQYATLAGN